MRWINVLLLTCACSAQPLEGPFLLFSDNDYSYLGDTFFCIQDDSTARLFYTRLSGGQSIQASRLYSLRNHDFVSDAVDLDSNYLDGTIDTAVVCGSRWAFYTHPAWGNHFVAGSDSVEINVVATNCCAWDGGVIPPWDYVPDLLARADGSWTFASLLTWMGVDGAPSWFCGQIVNLQPGSQDTILTQADTLFLTSESDIMICPLATDSFAVFHDDGWYEAPKISLVGRNTLINEVSFILDYFGNIERILDAEWVGGRQFRVLGTGSNNSDLYLIARNLDSLYEYSTFVDIPGSFWFDNLCRVPGYGWALIGQFTDEIRLLRIDTTGAVASPAGTVVWRAEGYRLDWSRIAADSSGGIYVYFGDYFPGNFRTRVQYVSLHWDTPLDARDTPAPVPQSVSLSAYPNPFNSTVRIDYELPQTSDVELTVHNTLGQEVAILHSGRAQAGTHSVNWSPDVASGVYFVKLASGDFATSRKVLYIR